MAKGSIPRREFLKVASAAGVAGAGFTPAPPTAEAAQKVPRVQAPSQTAPEGRLILTESETAFLTAAADTIIPADELSPSGSDCGIVTFIDRQLASAWGGGARMYRAGPFHNGTPEQGYQLPLTPRDFFASGIAAANEWSRKTYGKVFDRLTPAQRTEALKAMEAGKAEFVDFDSKLFFQRLLVINMEGFFSDPIYGGNRNKASWRMLQFPGLPATYADKIDEYRNKRYVAEPQWLGACEHCGFCSRNTCEANAKASSTVAIMPVLRLDPKFELRTRAFVSKLVYDKQGKKVTGVLYTDMKTGEEYEQPAGLVVLSAFVFGNTHMMLYSGIGQPYDHRSGAGLVGKNYCYQFEAGADAFFENKELNPYMGAPGGGVCIDDFNGENFDHAGLGFFGGGYLICSSGGATPMAGRAVPRGTPAFGSEWKRATVKWYYHFTRFNTQGSVYAHRDNYLDFDPTYKDALGRPLLRMTYNGTDNDHKMSAYLLAKVEGIIKAMNPTHYEMRPRPKNFTVVPYQSTHNTGGTMMGSNPGNSVVNRYLQAWDAHNLFIMGASVFPQQHGYNPTGTVGALAYWSADKIKKDYLKNPGPLVRA